MTGNGLSGVRSNLFLYFFICGVSGASVKGAIRPAEYIYTGYIKAQGSTYIPERGTYRDIAQLELSYTLD